MGSILSTSTHLPAQNSLAPGGFPSEEFLPIGKRRTGGPRQVSPLCTLVAFALKVSQVFTKADPSCRAAWSPTCYIDSLGWSCHCGPRLQLHLSLSGVTTLSPREPDPFSMKDLHILYLRHQCHCHGKCTCTPGPRHW